MDLLVTLQGVDLAIQQVETAIAAKPREIEALTRTRDEVLAILATRRKAFEDQDRERRRLEAEITQEQYNFQRAQRKLLDIKTNKEYTAMLTEIEGIKQKISGYEDTVLQLMEQAESQKGGIQEIEQRVEQEDLRLTEGRQRNQDEVAVLEQLLAEKWQRREEAMRRIERPLLDLYARLGRRKGVAVAGIKNGACQGCFLNLPPQLVQEVRRNDRILTCFHCHRILYWSTDSRQTSTTSDAPELVR